MGGHPICCWSACVDGMKLPGPACKDQEPCEFILSRLAHMCTFPPVCPQGLTVKCRPVHPGHILCQPLLQVPLVLGSIRAWCHGWQTCLALGLLGLLLVWMLTHDNLPSMWELAEVAILDG